MRRPPWLALLTACACASAPATVPAGTPAGAPAGAGACADEAPAVLPRSVVVELRVSPCAADRDPAACVEGLDSPGLAVVARVHADGRTERLAGDPAAGVEASDPRAFAGGLRWVRTTRSPEGEARHERVVVAPDGARSRSEGAAPRPILLGGRALDDPSSEDALRQALFVGDEEAAPEGAVLVDVTAPHDPIARIPLGGARSLSRQPYASAAGDALALALREGERTEWVVRDLRSGETRRRRVGNVQAAAPLAVSRDLRWVALRSAVRGVEVSGPGSVFELPVAPVLAAAFDPCNRWLWLAGGRQPRLIGVSLADGGAVVRSALPGWIERLEATPDGALLVASSLPGGAAAEPRALVLSPHDGRRVEIPLPAGTERVSNAF